MADFINQGEIIGSTFNINEQPQPLLHTPPKSNTEGARFHYISRSTEFVGREEEMQALRDFMDAEPIFLWTALIGKGGMGKSRLVLEFILAQNAEQIAAGFLTRNHTGSFAWHEWKPQKTTLICIDYASVEYDDIGKMIVALQNRSQAWQHPVRLLLIEREASGQWWEHFTKPTRHEFADYNAAFWHKPNAPKIDEFAPIALESLTKKQHWQIVTQILGDYHKTISNLKATKHDLEQLNVEGRTLYTILAAYALRQGESLRGWDRDKLLTYVLEREEDRIWKPFCAQHQISDTDLSQHKALLALATMCGGLTYKQAGYVWESTTLQEMPNIKIFREDLYAKLSDVQPNEKNPQYLAPYEPDIVGEALVLRTIQHISPNKRYKPYETWIEFAWEQEPFDFLFFLFRLLPDFVKKTMHPDDNIDKQNSMIVTLIQAKFLKNSLLELIWAQLNVFAIAQYGKAGEMEKAEKLYLELSELSSKTGSAEIKVARGKAILKHLSKIMFNFIVDEFMERQLIILSKIA